MAPESIGKQTEDGSTILVTGGAGYLGSVLVGLLLAEGHAVRVLDTLSFGGESLLSCWGQPRFEFIRGDIRDGDAVRRALTGVSSVVHLAATVGDPACARNPDLAYQVNVAGSLTLLEACRQQRLDQFVFASTCSNYGHTDHILMDETSPLKPLSLYAESKVRLENDLLSPSSDFGTTVTVLRFATLFGVSPRMRLDLTVNDFTHQLSANKTLVVYGGDAWRPYVHVRDAARAIQKVLNTRFQQERNIFNVGSNSQNFRKVDIVRLIEAHVKGAKIEYLTTMQDPRDYRVAFDKLSNELDFSITKTVDAGILELISLFSSGALSNIGDPKLRN